MKYTVSLLLCISCTLASKMSITDHVSFDNSIQVLSDDRCNYYNEVWDSNVCERGCKQAADMICTGSAGCRCVEGFYRCNTGHCVPWGGCDDYSLPPSPICGEHDTEITKIAESSSPPELASSGGPCENTRSNKNSKVCFEYVLYQQLNPSAQCRCDVGYTREDPGVGKQGCVVCGVTTPKPPSPPTAAPSPPPTTTTTVPPPPPTTRPTTTTTVPPPPPTTTTTVPPPPPTTTTTVPPPPPTTTTTVPPPPPTTTTTVPPPPPTTRPTTTTTVPPPPPTTTTTVPPPPPTTRPTTTTTVPPPPPTTRPTTTTTVPPPPPTTTTTVPPPPPTTTTTVPPPPPTTRPTTTTTVPPPLDCSWDNNTVPYSCKMCEDTCSKACEMRDCKAMYCRCIVPYRRDDNGKCVKYCPGVTPVPEKCPLEGQIKSCKECEATSCRDSKQDCQCVEGCIKECVCGPGYLNIGDVCIPKKTCEDKDCKDPNEIFRQCAFKKEPSCHDVNPAVNQEGCADFGRCQCKDGYVRGEKSNTCVPTSRCVCRSRRTTPRIY